MQNFVNAPHRGEARTTPTGSPNAALLIDFDNVTMGIRSDLTTQLKDLLNSDIIRGKVAVQRAYADWRRYAQYIVPLSEASVDLIFAPAYGSSKKNATDIRLAIDALELVFTRPEIGTYILLSGDSDFSSLVLKLKEYGKYVIGVGLRESASDLLVQNCDEYFSYSTLTGLTKAGEEDTVSAIDPWELVERSVARMAQENDVMRSDRLKQVMLDLDPSFDEAEIGYSKFNKFLTEAASRNRLALNKLGNGQYEVQPLATGGTPEKTDGGRGREPKRSRGRREESRSRRQPEPPKAIETKAEEPSKPERRESRPSQKPAPKPKAQERREEDLDHGYELLKRAIADLIDSPNDAARDSDIKRKMLELESGWDESELGFTKFSRFLRQAHDAEVIDLQRSREGYYEARLPSGVGSSGSKRDHSTQATRPAPKPKAEAKPEQRREERSSRESRGDRGTQATPAAEKKEAPKREAPEPKEKPTPKAETKPAPEARKESDTGQASSESKSRTGASDRAAAPKAEAEKPEPTTKDETSETQARGASYGRRDRRGRKAEGPPPLLPGQAVGSAPSGGTKETASQPEKQSSSAEVSSSSVPATPAEPKSEPEAGSRSSEPEARETEKVSTGSSDSRDSASDGGGAAVAEESIEPEFDADELGLPTESGAVIRYLSNSYQGVGQKTAEALIEAFGEDRVFNGLNSRPEKVREVLGSGRRTEILLEAWERDYRRRKTTGDA